MLKQYQYCIIKNSPTLLFELLSPGMCVYPQVTDLHVSRENVHGLGSSGDVGHRLAVVGDVQILHQDVVQHQFLKEPVSVVPRVGGAHPIHPRLDLGRLGAYRGRSPDSWLKSTLCWVETCSSSWLT